MKYFADILTFLRLVCAILIFLGVRLEWPVEVGLILFGIGELTDAFDGFCAKKWPFPENEVPKYRKYAAKYDMIADVLLWGGAVIYFMMMVNLGLGLVILGVMLILAYVVELRVYGRLFGHPDDCEKWSLCAQDFGKAKKIILARRMAYLLTIGILVLGMIFATSWAMWAKILLVALGVGIGGFLWFFLKTRRKNISREVDLEKALAKKASEKKN